MKIRNGFISNSSSSSFVIYGRSYTNESIAKVAKIKNDDPDFDEKICEYLEESGLTYNFCEDEWIIGRPLTDWQDDETPKIFKERTVEKMTKLFGNKKDKSSLENFDIIDAVVGSCGELEWG